MKPRSKKKKINRLMDQAEKLKDSKSPKCANSPFATKRPAKWERCMMRIDTLEKSK